MDFSEGTVEEEMVGKNMLEPIRLVKHADLKRIGDSAYKSVCPKCGQGFLGVSRDLFTLVLLEYDMCKLCGQRYQYEGIRALREMDGGKDGGAEDIQIIPKNK